MAAKSGDPRTATVKRIVTLPKKGLAYPAIAKVLNDEKVPTFRKGKVWYGPTVRAVCLREFGGADESLAAAGTKRPTGFSSRVETDGTHGPAKRAGCVETHPMR